MAKRGIKDLALAVSEKHHFAQKEAELFITTIFNVLNDGLHQEQIVKVKGLGTFKVIDIKDRESVDVNTGSRIMIAGRKKITFAPDAVMKDLVNRPFSQFETVVLNDGVSFGDLNSDDNTNTLTEDEIEEKQEQLESQEIFTPNNPLLENDIPPKTNNQEIEEKKENSVETENNQEEVELKKTKEESLNELENAETLKDEKYQCEEEIIQTEVQTQDFANSDMQEEPLEEPKEEGTKSEHPNIVLEESLSEEAIEKPTEHEKATSHLHHYHHRKKSYSRKGLVLGLFLCFILLIGGFTGGWYAHNQYIKMHSLVQKQKKVLRYAEAVSEKDIKVTEKKDEPPKSQPANNVKSKIASQKETEKINSTTEGIAHPKTKDEMSSLLDLPKSENDSRTMKNAVSAVKTGAYTIVGTQETITVRKGQTLKKLSKYYFGEGMECYLMVHNGITEAKEGMSLKIPKLKIKKLR